MGRGAHSQRRGVRAPPSAAGTGAPSTAAARPPGTAPHTASCGATDRQEGRRVSRRAARLRRYPPTTALAAAAAQRRCSRCRSRRGPPRSPHRAATAPHSSAAAAPAACPSRPRCGIQSPPRRSCRAESRCARWSSCDAQPARLHQHRHVSVKQQAPARSEAGLAWGADRSLFGARPQGSLGGLAPARQARSASRRTNLVNAASGERGRACVAVRGRRG